MCGGTDEQKFTRSGERTPVGVRGHCDTVRAVSVEGPELSVDIAETTCRVRGEIDAHTAPRLDDAIQQVLAAGPSIELDLTDVSFMDSSGLRIVLAATNTARERGGDVVIANPSAVVARLIEVSGLVEHLSVRIGPA